MIKQSIIVLLSISIILQNTCLMGAAGQSILFKALNKGCHMRCNLACRAKSPSDNGGVKSYKKDIEENGTHVICYFQFKAEEIATPVGVPKMRQAYWGSDEQLKRHFLDPPTKPPSTVIFC